MAEGSDQCIDDIMAPLSKNRGEQEGIDVRVIDRPKKS
jgi:hypothetical protein